MKISIIAAVAENGVIGVNNKLPWRLDGDLRRFRELTTGHVVIMGRRTYESIGRPLPDRINVVISREKDFSAAGCLTFHSLDEALENFKNEAEVFIIGGSQIYQAALPLADTLYLTVVHAKPEGDVSFPAFDQSKWKVISQEEHQQDEKNEYNYTFFNYERIK